MKNIFSITTLLLLFTFSLTAQDDIATQDSITQEFDVTAEIRPRFENKNGYKSLKATDADAASFVSQRTRLNFGFKNERLNAFVSMQNVRVWGDVGTMGAQDNVSPGVGTGLHQAWAEAYLSDKVAFKLGRQEIVYDDHRIFGTVGWAQQARSHDAFLVKFTPNKNNRLDVGFAFSEDSQAGVDNIYSGVAGYKAMQYAWYHGNFNKFGLSVLLLNTGKEYLKNAGLANESQKIDYMQTIGPRLTYKGGKLSGDAAVYFQSGKTVNKDVGALYYSANLGYKITDEFSAGIGMEYLSGKDMNDGSSDVKSFAPLFGTNHKFNGLMDYFYVGNHGGSVGLTDIYFSLAYKKNKFSAKLVPHMFSTAADVYNNSGTKMDASLGTEIDFTLGYKVAKDISINAGYSQMLATDTMEVLKGGDKDEHNSWGWLMVTFKPTLFSSKK
jgi:hypothetical protein